MLFDLNRSTKFGPLLRSGATCGAERVLPPAPRRFRTTLITNAASSGREVVEQVTEAGATTVQTRPIGLEFPLEVFSLSHLALPFPVRLLYGLAPDDRTISASTWARWRCAANAVA